MHLLVTPLHKTEAGVASCLACRAFLLPMFLHLNKLAGETTDTVEGLLVTTLLEVRVHVFCGEVNATELALEY